MNVCVRERNKRKRLRAKTEDRAIDVARKSLSRGCRMQEKCENNIGYSQSHNRV